MKTKQQIINLLRITEAEYAKAVEAFGYSFIRYYCAGSTGAEEYLTRTGAFWKWWMRHFDIRDEIFLADYGSYTALHLVDDVRDNWNDSHQPETIEGRIPDAAWMQMLDAIDEEENAQRPVYAEINQTPCIK